MIRRLLLVIFVLMFLGLVWIGSLGAVVLSVFQQRHPDKCMARYYKTFTPEVLNWECDGSKSKINWSSDDF